jgi:hypothetical protein
MVFMLALFVALLAFGIFGIGGWSTRWNRADS